MVHAQCFDLVQRHEHFHQEVLVFFFEWKCKSIDNAVYKNITSQSHVKHTVNITSWLGWWTLRLGVMV